MIRHQYSLFPVVIAMLTLVLIIFMAWTFIPTQKNENQNKIDPVSYELSVKTIIASFSSEYYSKQDDLQKLVVVEETLESLLKLTVPVEYKTAHMDLVFSLTLLKEGMRNEQADLKEKGTQKLNETFQKYSWID